MEKSAKRNAFTLVELLVVIAIISILAALLLPALEGALQQARTVHCANNQKQLHMAMAQYADSWNGAVGKMDHGMGGLPMYAQFLNRIMQPNYVYGDSRITMDHGSWLEGGLADPALYFCPDVTYDKKWGSSACGPIQEHYRAYTGYMRQLLETGGKQWDAKSYLSLGGTPDVNFVWIYNQTSYAFNRLLIPGVYFGSGWKKTGMVREDGAGCKLGNLRSDVPVLVDSRSYSYSSAYHGGRGWNVCYADGSVQFCTTASAVNAGIENNVSSRYQYWVGFTRAPDDPRLDPDILAAGIYPVMHSATGMDSRNGWLWTTLRHVRR